MTDSPDTPVNDMNSENTAVERLKGVHWRRRSRAQVDERNAQIWECSVRGMTVRQIAAQFGMSPSAVHYILVDVAKRRQEIPLEALRKRAADRLDLAHAVAQRVIEDGLQHMQQAIDARDPEVAAAIAAQAYENLLKGQAALLKAQEAEARTFGYAAPDRLQVSAPDADAEEAWRRQVEATKNELAERRRAKRQGRNAS